MELFEGGRIYIFNTLRKTMKANELRIGNYVKDSVSGEVMVVNELGENVGAVLLNRDKYPLPDGWQMAYIPLTPEILEKAGFIQISDYDPEGPTHRMNSSIGVIDVCYGYSMVDIVQNIGRIRHNKIKYLHQLQNLYFALTGEELTINL